MAGEMSWVGKKIHLYNVTMGLYMLDWWERCLFNILVLILLWFICFNGSRFATDVFERSVGMEGCGFRTQMVNGDEDPVVSLDDISLPMTQQTHDLALDGEQFEVQPSEVVEVPRKAKGAAKRTKNFAAKEDEILCSAWLNVSKDPINGANQTRSKFWNRVLVYFEQHKETPYVRTESSLMHRWSTIQYQVNKFCSYYDDIERRNQSGKTIQDKISDALEMYMELDKDKKSFTLIPCWNKLKEQDKWKARRAELLEQEKAAAGKKTKKDNAVSTPRNAEATTNEDLTEKATPNSEERKRPDGVKKAKEALKRGSGEACMEVLDKLWAKKQASDNEREEKRQKNKEEREEKREKKKEERFLVSLEVEKNRLAIEAKRVEAELMKEEKEIMEKDMASLTSTQRQYYEMMQQKIITRRLAS